MRIDKSIYSTDLEWCRECIDRLMWGYHVSCVVSIVTENRSVGIDVFIEGSCIYASTWGLQDGPVRPCDEIPVYVWMTVQFKDVLRGSPGSGDVGLETGPVARTELAVFDLNWLDGHPNRRGGSVITRTDATVTQYCSYMGEIPTEDGAQRNWPAVWIYVLEYSSRVCEGLERYRYSMNNGVFPVEGVDRLSVMPGTQRAAKYMTAMGLWRPPSDPGAPEPLPMLTCTSCMNCEYCLAEKSQRLSDNYTL